MHCCKKETPKTGCLTISKKDSSAAVPALENLLIQHHLGDAVFGGPIDVISKSDYFSIFAAGQFEVSDLVAHIFGGLLAPLRVDKGVVVFGRFFGQELDHYPAHGVPFGGKREPLLCRDR